ncbi:MAG: hypothetical protein ACTHN5_20920 [Phycisphaerae bacterium]
MNVRIVDTPRPDSINFYHEWEVIRSPASHRSFLVYTQGDRTDHPWADLTLAQSPAMVTTPKHYLIDMWPQPGLVKRDSARGDRIERLGYVGPLENLARGYRTPEFRQSLKELGVELVIKNDPASWHDFRDLDLFIAVRDWPWYLIKTKPATKLVHAWITGVPAILGPEPAYQHWGCHGKDYFQVHTPNEALALVRRLKTEPDLYRSIQAHGSLKAADHNEPAVIGQWKSLLDGPIRDAFEAWRIANGHTWQYRAVKRQWHRLSAPVWQKWFTLRSKRWRAVSRTLAARRMAK